MAGRLEEGGRLYEEGECSVGIGGWFRSGGWQLLNLGLHSGSRLQLHIPAEGAGGGDGVAGNKHSQVQVHKHRGGSQLLGEADDGKVLRGEGVRSGGLPQGDRGRGAAGVDAQEHLQDPGEFSHHPGLPQAGVFYR